MCEGGVRDALRSSEPCPSQSPSGAALSHQPHPAPRSMGGGCKWPGLSDRGTDAGGGFRGSFEGQAGFSQGQNGGHALALPAALWCGHLLSQLATPTALAGKELTSQLLSKNVELLIPTA